MSSHVPHDLLTAFVDGDVGDQLAIHIAGHLDECPACATRAATLEPMATVFASLEDPVPPVGLAEAALEEYRRPVRLPVVEVAVGFALLALATVAATLLGDPIASLADAGTLLDALPIVGAEIFHGITTSGVALVAAALTAVLGAGFVARSAWMERGTP